MNFRLPWRTNNKPNELYDVEQRLDALLTPVAPRPEFVNELRQQLVGVNERRWLGMRGAGFLLCGLRASVQYSHCWVHWVCCKPANRLKIRVYRPRPQ